MGIPLIGGLIDGGSSGNKKREEEERRKAEEAARQAEEAAEERRAAEEAAAEERQAELEAAAESQRERALGAFERREVREDDRGDPVLQRRALETIASEAPETPERESPTTPRFQMTIPENEIRFTPTARVLEDEIRVTPNAPAQQRDPYEAVLAASARFQQGESGGRPVNFDALDAQADRADVASQRQATANLAGPPPAAGAPPVAPPTATPPPTAAPAPAPVAPPAGPGAAPAPSSLPSLGQPPATPLPQQQRDADMMQRAQMPQGARIPADVRTAAMPRPDVEQRTQAPQNTSGEDEARRALRVERTLKALGYITKLGLGAGALALDARGGSPAAAQFMAGAGGMVGNAMIGASPTQQQARIAQARGMDEQRARTAEDLDLRRVAQAAQERRAQMLEAQQSQRLDLEGRRVAAMEEGLGLRAEQVGAQAEAARALALQRASQGERQSEEAALEAARLDPESEVSRQAQRELMAVNATRPVHLQMPQETIEGLSANAAAILMREMSRPLGERRTAVASGGGGGGAGARDALGPTQSFREFAAREYPQLAGLGEAEREATIAQAWSQLSGAERRAYTAGSAMAESRESQQAVERANSIPGWRLAEGVPPPDVVTIRTAQQLAASDSTMNRSLSTALDLIGRIGPGERLGSAIGWDNATTTRYRNAIDTAISEMTSYVNTGALNEADQARYERMFGSLTDPVPAEVLRERLAAIRDGLGAKARTRMESLGFSRGGGGGGGGGGSFIVTPPGGRPLRTSNPQQVERARARGWAVEAAQ